MPATSGKCYIYIIDVLYLKPKRNNNKTTKPPQATVAGIALLRNICFYLEMTLDIILCLFGFFFFFLMSTFRERKCQNTILFKKEKSYLLCKSRVEILAIT